MANEQKKRTNYNNKKDDTKLNSTKRSVLNDSRNDTNEFCFLETIKRS